MENIFKKIIHNFNIRDFLLKYFEYDNIINVSTENFFDENNIPYTKVYISSKGEISSNNIFLIFTHINIYINISNYKQKIINKVFSTSENENDKVVLYNIEFNIDTYLNKYASYFEILPYDILNIIIKTKKEDVKFILSDNKEFYNTQRYLKYVIGMSSKNETIIDKLLSDYHMYGYYDRNDFDRSILRTFDWNMINKHYHKYNSLEYISDYTRILKSVHIHTWNYENDDKVLSNINMINNINLDENNISILRRLIEKLDITSQEIEKYQDRDRYHFGSVIEDIFGLSLYMYPAKGTNQIKDMIKYLYAQNNKLVLQSLIKYSLFYTRSILFKYGTYDNFIYDLINHLTIDLNYDYVVDYLKIYIQKNVNYDLSIYHDNINIIIKYGGNSKYIEKGMTSFFRHHENTYNSLLYMYNNYDDNNKKIFIKYLKSFNDNKSLYFQDIEIYYITKNTDYDYNVYYKNYINSELIDVNTIIKITLYINTLYKNYNKFINMLSSLNEELLTKIFNIIISNQFIFHVNKYLKLRQIYDIIDIILEKGIRKITIENYKYNDDIENYLIDTGVYFEYDIPKNEYDSDYYRYNYYDSD
jgi:hypothetical protein